MFGKYICRCDNCGRNLYDGDTFYYADIGRKTYCLCENCCRKGGK